MVVRREGKPHVMYDVEGEADYGSQSGLPLQVGRLVLPPIDLAIELQLDALDGLFKVGDESLVQDSKLDYPFVIHRLLSSIILREEKVGVYPWPRC